MTASRFYRVMPILAMALAASAIPARAQTNALPKWTATQDMVIDGAKHEFTWLRILTVDKSGFVYAGESQDQTIRGFDPSGNLVRTIGRKGGGPGEFKQMLQSGFVGDSLWVYDEAARRLTIFAPDGRYARSLKLESVAPAKLGSMTMPRLSNPVPRALYLDGTILASGSPPAEPPAQSHGARGIPLIRASTSGVFRGLVAWQHPIQDWANVYDGKSSAGAMLPFPNNYVNAVSADGEYYAEAGAILRGDTAGLVRLTVVRAGGDTAYSRLFPASMIPIPEQVLDSAFKARAASIRKSTLGDKLADVILNSPRPEFYPPLRGLTVARDGAVLVAFAPIDGKREYLIFEPDGAPRASFSLPSNVFLRSFEGDRVWGTIDDADGVPSIVRYRLTAPAK